MDRNTVIFMVLSGLCILPSCFPQLYHIVKDAKTWTEAQSYCREKHTDLVTINSEEDMVNLSHMLWDGDDERDDDEFWIGLYGDFYNWKWSLEREGFYKEGEAEFRKWHGLEPNIYMGPFMCANIAPFGGWSDAWCNILSTFVCYNEFSKNRYIYVRTRLKWTDAQRYCRERYTDLASVRTTTENEEIRMLVDDYAWIGLYRESWKWSDGQLMQMTSFSNWNVSQPDKIIGSCATTTHSKWNARPCNNKYAFVCSGWRKHVVKVMLTKSNSSVDLEEMQDAITQQFSQRLRGVGLREQVRLKWIKQPDGKIFHLKEREEEKEREKRKGKDAEEKSCIPKS